MFASFSEEMLGLLREKGDDVSNIFQCVYYICEWILQGPEGDKGVHYLPWHKIQHFSWALGEVWKSDGTY